MTASSQPRAFSQTIASVTGDAGDSRYGDTRRRKTLHAISSTNTLHAISSTNTLHAISSTNTSNRSRSDSSSSSMSSSAGTRVYRACAHKVSCTCGDTGEADWARLGGKCACQCKCVGECDSAHRPLLHGKATEKIGGAIIVLIRDGALQLSSRPQQRISLYSCLSPPSSSSSSSGTSGSGR